MHTPVKLFFYFSGIKRIDIMFLHRIQSDCLMPRDHLPKSDRSTETAPELAVVGRAKTRTRENMREDQLQGSKATKL